MRFNAVILITGLVVTSVSGTPLEARGGKNNCKTNVKDNEREIAILDFQTSMPAGMHAVGMSNTCSGLLEPGQNPYDSCKNCMADNGNGWCEDGGKCVKDGDTMLYMYPADDEYKKDGYTMVLKPEDKKKRRKRTPKGSKGGKGGGSGGGDGGDGGDGDKDVPQNNQKAAYKCKPSNRGECTELSGIAMAYQVSYAGVCVPA